MPSPLPRPPAGILRVIRALVPLVIAAVCLRVLFQRVDSYDLGSLTAGLDAIAPIQWAGAIAATYVSFWALGRYDAVAHRHFGTGIRSATARRAGAIAIAFSQSVGFGVLSGTFARWRLVPGLSVGQAARVTVFVAVTFLLALGALLSLTVLVTPLAPDGRWLGALGIALALGLLGLAFACPVIRLGAWSLRLPSLPALGAIALWTVVDTAAAGLALWLLIPAETALPFHALLPAYLAALAVALLSGAPGGVGPFELCLLALLGPLGEPELLTGMIAFRMVYFAAPALIGGAALLRAPSDARQLRAPRHDRSLPGDAARVETGVLRQNRGRVLRMGPTAIAMLETPQASVGLFDPLSGSTPRALALVAEAARSSNRLPCLYKCSDRAAVEARRVGWIVRRIAQEAVLRPGAATPGRQLRRKLKAAEKAGVTVTSVLPSAGATLPWTEMERIDAEWQARCGRARGTTMGRFEPGYVARQAVFLAWQADRLVGYITLHVGAREWCLDLMRATGDAPDGTMHRLVMLALDEARAADIPRLSLAAVPDHALSPFGRCGLAQFKTSFAPTWTPLYLAAPNAAAFLLAAADIARAVRWPDPPEAECDEAQEEDEKNEFAIAVGP